MPERFPAGVAGRLAGQGGCVVPTPILTGSSLNLCWQLPQIQALVGLGAGQGVKHLCGDTVWSRPVSHIQEGLCFRTI